ncbi:MAG: hypothetical protein HQM16_16295 [Deltaproteobacteria bacterium]|nr:hypothetical protein [Deltaproteobacteria bacterium]
MKIILHLLLILLIILLIPTMAHAGDFHPEATPALEQNLIWVEASSKSDSEDYFLEFRVWFTQPAEKVFKLLTDTMGFKNKMTNYKDTRTLTQKLYKEILNAKPKNPAEVVTLIGQNRISSHHNRQKNSHWNDYTYLHFNFPWPLTDRWAVQKVDIDETNAHKGEYKYTYETKLGNFKKLDGQWEIVPITGHSDWTEFRGFYKSNPGIPVPKFVTKKVMKASFKKEMDANRRLLQK